MDGECCAIMPCNVLKPHQENIALGIPSDSVVMAVWMGPDGGYYAQVDRFERQGARGGDEAVERLVSTGNLLPTLISIIYTWLNSLNFKTYSNIVMSDAHP